VEPARTPLNAFAESIDGLRLPRALGGHPAVDFCNTMAGWDDPRPADYLTSFDHLVMWAAGAGLLDVPVATHLRRRAASRPGEALRALEDARAFRAALRAVLLDSRPGTQWRLVRSVVLEATAAIRLGLVDGLPRWVLPPALGPRLPLLAIARSAAELLTTREPGAVRACPGAACGWVFLDPTGRRRWCTMAACGNRAKVRRFAERRLTERAAGGGRRRRSVSSSRGSADRS
jgi:predicted RNA-binding Zn ribbon-like protein